MRASRYASWLLVAILSIFGHAEMLEDHEPIDDSAADPLEAASVTQNHESHGDEYPHSLAPHEVSKTIDSSRDEPSLREDSYETEASQSFATTYEDHSATDTEPLTLDELLQQISDTPHMQQEAMLARLAERRRLAIALRSTLEAAEQVATYGEAGAQLLQDATLDAIVATMIAAQETTAVELAEASPAIVAESTPSDTKGEVADTIRGLVAWRPVYIVREPSGHRVGWLHLESGVRKSVYVGEVWRVDADVVTVIEVRRNPAGHILLVDRNGERLEIAF